MASLENYYIQKYGPPEKKGKFVSPEGVVIHILKWSEHQTDEGATIYATLGASNILGNSSHGCEFFIGLTPPVDDIFESLAEVALHGNGTSQIPSSGDSITLSYKLWSDSCCSAYMFTDGSELMNSTIDENGKLIEFIQLVPLSDSELGYKRKYGEEKLWEKFEENLVPYWDSTRSGS